MSEPPAAASVAETHISVLLFTGDRAYKLLKAVDLGFLDHREVAARAEAAHREVELNRRLAADVYLGLGEISEGDEVTDHLIVMRRLPTERALSALVGTDELDDQVDAVARMVADFHCDQPPITDVASTGGEGGHRVETMATPEALGALWSDNVADLERFVGSEDDASDTAVLHAGEVARVAELAHGYLTTCGPLFARRIDEGRVRDGHGDLLADDIYCLDDGPRILDCLAFRDDLRIADILADVAFLAMDLERLSGVSAAARLLATWAQATGDEHPDSLAHHYIAYRAHVRAKVACLRHESGDPGAADRARHLHRLALDHLEAARPRLVLVGGLPGTGKSTVARGLGDSLGWSVLRSDEIRRELTATGADGTSAPDAPGEGRYTPETTEATYDEVRRRAAVALGLGGSAILDASWTDAAQREATRTWAGEIGAQVTELACTLPTDVARERVAQRRATGRDASEATPEIVDHLSERQAAWPEAITIDTGPPKDEVLAAARAAIDPRAPARWGSAPPPGAGSAATS